MFAFVWDFQESKSEGPNRDLNPGPPAPKAGIIPLDHLATSTIRGFCHKLVHLRFSMVIFFMELLCYEAKTMLSIEKSH